MLLAAVSPSVIPWGFAWAERGGKMDWSDGIGALAQTCPCSVSVRLAHGKGPLGDHKCALEHTLQIKEIKLVPDYF